MGHHIFRLCIASMSKEGDIDWRAETIRGSIGISEQEALRLINEFKEQTSSETADATKPTMPGVNIKRLNKKYYKWMVVLH